MKPKRVKNKLNLQKLKIATLENSQSIITGGIDPFFTLRIDCRDSKTVPINPIDGGN